MKLRESGENYLDTIYNLGLKNGEVRSIDIAQALGYSKPSISRAMSILKQKGYIQIEEKSGIITFTEEGLVIAKDLYNRHSIIAKFLVKTLGIEMQIADYDACRIEHVISPETIDCMREYLKRNK